MNWAKNYILELEKAGVCKFRPRGNSMVGKINSGQLVTVHKIPLSDYKIGDITLCKVNGNIYLHLIKAIQGDRFLIGNNRGGTNGWTKTLYGKCVEVAN